MNSPTVKKTQQTLAEPATAMFAKIANLSASKIIFEMVGSLAQDLSRSVITDFTRLEFCIQAGAIWKVSKHFT